MPISQHESNGVVLHLRGKAKAARISSCMADDNGTHAADIHVTNSCQTLEGHTKIRWAPAGTKSRNQKLDTSCTGFLG